jgi:hypothetical protein
MLTRDCLVTLAMLWKKNLTPFSVRIDRPHLEMLLESADIDNSDFPSKFERRTHTALISGFGL